MIFGDLKKHDHFAQKGAPGTLELPPVSGEVQQVNVIRTGEDMVVWAVSHLSWFQTGSFTFHVRIPELAEWMNQQDGGVNLGTSEFIGPL